MGYFSNGTEGLDYEKQWCGRCLNYEQETMGCPVLDLHLLYNYSQCDNNFLAFILGHFIPRSKDGLTNKRCVMFRGNGDYIGQKMNAIEKLLEFIHQCSEGSCPLCGAEDYPVLDDKKGYENVSAEDAEEWQLEHHDDCPVVYLEQLLRSQPVGCMKEAIELLEKIAESGENHPTLRIPRCKVCWATIAEGHKPDCLLGKALTLLRSQPSAGVLATELRKVADLIFPSADETAAKPTPFGELRKKIIEAANCLDRQAEELKEKDAEIDRLKGE